MQTASHRTPFLSLLCADHWLPVVLCQRLNEQRAADEKRQQDEKDFLKYQAQHLEAFLKQAQQ